MLMLCFTQFAKHLIFLGIECEMCPLICFTLPPKLYCFLRQIKCVHLTLMHKEITSDWITSQLVLPFFTS